MKKRVRVRCPECRKRKEFTDRNFIRSNFEVKRFIGKGCRMDFEYNFTGTIHTWNDERGETESETFPLCRACIRYVMGHMEW